LPGNSPTLLWNPKTIAESAGAHRLVAIPCWLNPTAALVFCFFMMHFVFYLRLAFSSVLFPLNPYIPIGLFYVGERPILFPLIRYTLRKRDSYSTCVQIIRMCLDLMQLMTMISRGRNNEGPYSLLTSSSGTVHAKMRPLSLIVSPDISFCHTALVVLTYILRSCSKSVAKPADSSDQV
jgi:hypothetical protein